MDTALAVDDLNRLKWRCRRGLLENDLFVERFFHRHGDGLTPRQAAGVQALMDLPDPELLDLLLARTEPADALDRADVREVLSLMRTPAAAHAGPSPSKVHQGSL